MMLKIITMWVIKWRRYAYVCVARGGVLRRRYECVCEGGGSWMKIAMALIIFNLIIIIKEMTVEVT